MKVISLPIFVAILFLYSCNDRPSEADLPAQEWTIPTSQVFDGGVGKDGIPSIDNPGFMPASSIETMNLNELVVGLRNDEVVRAYPHRILDYHEIVNDEAGDWPIALNYCPLTGTAYGWSRLLDNQLTTFGVSGFLYNSNLIPYDRRTESYWSQMRNDCVSGELIHQVAISYPIVEMNWLGWKELFPDSDILTENTGWDRPYGHYPYGSYKSSSSLIFPVDELDARLHPKERVLYAEIEGDAIVFTKSAFPETMGYRQMNINGRDILLIGSREYDFMTVYYTLDESGNEYEFESLPDRQHILMKDAGQGNYWDLFGYADSGPSAGSRLTKPDNVVVGYWFAVGAFYKGVEIIE